jgi:hypothetical protein
MSDKSELRRLAGIEQARPEWVLEAKGKLKWEQKDTTIFVAFPKITYTPWMSDKDRTSEIALRVDGRSKTWRVDKKTLSYLPFEAIDDGRGFPTEAEAKAYAEKWVAAANEQKTLDPKV